MLRRGFGTAGESLLLRLDRGERDVVGDLLEQLVAFVSPAPEPEQQDPLARLVGIDEQAQRPADQALLRLLPDAYRDDESAADDFRRFTERDLREQKAANALLARQTLARADSGRAIAISAEEARAWLLALNDLRLTLAVRLGITDDEDDDRDPVYDWLTWLQSTLVEAIAP